MRGRGPSSDHTPARCRGRLSARGTGVVVSVLTLAVLAGPGSGGAQAVPGIAIDAWSPPIELVQADGSHLAPIHATLMPSGQVLLVGRSRPTAQGTTETVFAPAAAMLNPTGPDIWVQAALRRLQAPVAATGLVNGAYVVNDDLFCMGSTLTADGKFFSAGGTRNFDSATQPQIVTGLPYATVFDGTTWTRLADEMQAVGPAGVGRWYPTVTRLPDGRMLTTSGYDQVVPRPIDNLSTEVYTPAGGWQVASPVGKAPFEILNSNYTHAFVLPSPTPGGDVLMFGEPGVPVFTSAADLGTWVVSNAARPGSAAFQASRLATGGSWTADVAPDNGATSTLLPIRSANGSWGYDNGSVLVAGGAHATAFDQAADVYDPVTDAWQPTVNTGIARHDPASVLLPDGRVLIVGGEESGPDITRAEYVDPAQNMAFSVGSSDGGEVRGYHNVALLLPDGSVLVGGGRDLVSATSVEKTNFRYYYPSYMFGPRPAITAAPGTIARGMPFVVSSTGAAPTEGVLMALGSMTHSIDMNQRSVQVALGSLPSLGTTHLSMLTAPASAHVAPPGYYLLFVLDANRVPSAARIVQLT